MEEEGSQCWWEKLPFELEEIIWLRLPARYIFPLQSICNAWHARLSNPSFLHTCYAQQYGGPRDNAKEPWKETLKKAAMEEPTKLMLRLNWAAKHDHVALIEKLLPLMKIRTSWVPKDRIELTLSYLAEHGHLQHVKRVLELQPYLWELNTTASEYSILPSAVASGNMELFNYLSEKLGMEAVEFASKTTWVQSKGCLRNRHDTCLWVALRKGHLAIAKKLLQLDHDMRGMTPATKSGNLELVKYLREYMEYPITITDYEQYEYKEFVDVALIKKHWEVAEYLLQEGANMQPRFSLELAAKKRNKPMIDFVLSHWPKNDEQQDRQKAFYPALAEAARNGDSELFFYLLSHSGHTGPLPAEMLTHAATGCNFEILEECVAMGTDLDEDNTLGKIINDAAEDVAIWLLEKGANPCVLQLSWFTKQSVLYVACSQSRSKLALSLVHHISKRLSTQPHRARAEIDYRDAGDTALMSAVKNGLVDVVEALLDAGASPDYQTWKTGWTAICFACSQMARKRKQVLELMLRKGVNANIKNFDWTTPLSLAASSCKPSLISLLVEKGKVPLDGFPLHAVFTYAGNDQQLFKCQKTWTQRQLETLKCLIGYGANVNETNQEEDTPLDTLCRQFVPEKGDILKYLLEQGAKPSPRTLLNAAHRHPNEIVFQVLDLIEENNNINEREKETKEEDKNEEQDTFRKILSVLLIKAAGTGNKELFDRMILSGADVNFVNDASIEIDVDWAVEDLFGETPLTVCLKAQIQSLDYIETLLEHGADPTMRNRVGRSPIDIATSRADTPTEILDLLRSFQK